MGTDETLTTEKFESMTPEEKSKVSGTRFLSDEELVERVRKSNTMSSDLILYFFSKIVAQFSDTEIVVSTEEYEKKMEVVVNDLFEQAVKSGATMADLAKVQQTVFLIGQVLDRMQNATRYQLNRFNYSIFKENDISDVAIRDILEKTLEMSK